MFELNFILVPEEVDMEDLLGSFIDMYFYSKNALLKRMEHKRYHHLFALDPEMTDFYYHKAIFRFAL